MLRRRTVLNKSQDEDLIKKDKEGFQESGTWVIDIANSQTGDNIGAWWGELTEVVMACG